MVNAYSFKRLRIGVGGVVGVIFKGDALWTAE